MTRNRTKKKSLEGIKEELLASMIETVNEEDYSGLNKVVKMQIASQ